MSNIYISYIKYLAPLFTYTSPYIISDGGINNKLSKPFFVAYLTQPMAMYRFVLICFGCA